MKKKIIIAAIVIAFVIAMVVLHLIAPKISYQYAELMCSVSFAFGACAGYLIKDHIR